MSDISFEFDVLIMGDRCEASEAFAKSHADWKFVWWEKGGFLAEPPQLPDDGLGVASLVARYIDAYAAPLSALRLLGKDPSIRIAIYFDITKIAALSLVLKPSTMAMIAMLGYEIDFCVYPCAPDEEE